jgi:hypothetical protein
MLHFRQGVLEHFEGLLEVGATGRFVPRDDVDQEVADWRSCAKSRKLRVRGTRTRLYKPTKHTVNVTLQDERHLGTNFKFRIGCLQLLFR